MAKDAELVDFDEVLKILSVSPEKLEDLVIAGELAAFRRGRAIRFRKQDVAEYLVHQGSSKGAPAKLEADDRRAKAVAAKIASLRRSQADGASDLLQKMGGGGGDELISVKEKIEGRGATAGSPEEILVELQRELSAARRKADNLEQDKTKLTGQLQLLGALREEVKQVAVLARENEELRKSLSGRQGDVAAAEQAAQLQRERDKLKERLKGAEDALGAVQGRASEVSSLKAEKRELEQKLEQARTEARASLYVSQDDQVRRAVANIEELSSERKKLLEDVEGFRKQAAKLEARLSAVEAERDGAVRKLKASQGSLKAVSTKDEEIERLERELEEARKELDTATEEAAADLKTENELLKSELTELRDKFEESVKAEGLVQELRSQVESLRNEGDELKEELRAAQVTLGHMRADSAQSKQRAREVEEARGEVRELRKEYDQISARLHAAEAARDQAEKEIEKLRAQTGELDSAAGEVSAAREEASAARAELESVSAALEEEKERAQDFEEEKARLVAAQGEREAEVSSLKEEMEKLRASLEKAEAEAPAPGELDSLRAELEQASSRSSELEEELNRARAQLEAAAKPEDIDRLSSELEEARSRSSELERELEQARQAAAAPAAPEELDSIRAELEEARSRSSELERELEGAREQIDTAAPAGPQGLKAQLEEARALASELEHERKEANKRLQGAARAKRVKKLELEMDEARSRAEELERMVARAEGPGPEEIAALRENLERVSAELESAKAEKEEALAEAEALKGVAGESGKSRAEMEELSAQLAGAKEESDAHRLELSRKEGALAALQAQLEKSRDVETEAKGLAEQLAELREKLARVGAEAGPLRKERDELAARLREADKARAAIEHQIGAVAAGPAFKRSTAIMVGGVSLPPSAPKQVGRFTLLGLIGQGRKGLVCTASSPYAAGVAAVRILPEHLLADAQFMEHFLPRIRRVAELENKSIVDVLDTGEYPGGYFVATELLDGGSLRERLEATDRIGPEETLAIVMQLTKALEVVRRAELVHRDIRPENILFTRDGTPKLSDLGLSLGSARDGCSAGRGWVRQYAAPEQIRGEEVDCRADVFSLGAVAYEMLTGRAAFQAATADGAAGLHDSAVLDPPDCPPDLAGVVARMLCKSPDDRHAAPKDLATDLILLSDGREPKTAAPEEGKSFVRSPA